MTDNRRGRIEDARLTTGRGRYASDLHFEGMARAFFVRAPHAHATLTSLDASAAEGMPGVVAVLTAEHLAQDGVDPFSVPVKLEGPDGTIWTHTPRPFLIAVGGRSRFVGEPVALVVAETLAQAMDAAEAVEADYDEAPAVLGIPAAKADGAPLVYDDKPGNVAFHWARGDMAKTEAALKGSAHVAHLDTHVSRVAAATMEPRACAGVPAADGRTTLYISHQNAPAMRGATARILGLAPEQVHVVAQDVGGSFGMKSGPVREEIVTFWAARRLDRPVRWVADRTESMLTDEPGRDIDMEGWLGLDAEGRFTALKVVFNTNVGAYCSGRSLVATFNFGGVSGVYVIPTTAGEVIGRFTNATPSAPYRGAGRPEATFIIEALIDKAARELGVDPFELRKRNVIPAEKMPYDTGFLFDYDSGDFAAVMDQAAERADISGYAARREASRKAGKLRGVGVVNCIEVAGGPFGNAGPDFSRVKVSPDGRVQLGVGAMSAGQGVETSLVGLAAGWLGVGEEQIDYVQGDTDVMDVGKGMGGSAMMAVGAAAVQEGVRLMLDQAKEIAATEMEVSQADVEYDSGVFRVAGTDKSMSLGEIARVAESRGAGLGAQGEFKPSDCTYPNGCHVCEVEVDPETGVVRFDRYAAVEDIGKVLYPQMAEGQIHGGVAQALGQVLCEELRYDEDGQMLSATFMDYAMPRATDLPEYSCGFSEITPTQINPMGAKGVGEAGSVGGMAAGILAVCDALAGAGVKDFAMPASPHRVWAALQAARS